MAKKITKRPTPKARSRDIAEVQKIINEVVKHPRFNPQAFANGMTSVLFGFNPGSLAPEINQSDTMRQNLRGYLISNDRQLMNESYVEHGTIRSAVCVPVDDALRGGVNFISKQLSSEQVAELTTFYEQENVLHGAVGQGEMWNRLFGGAGIMPILPQDPETPFEVSSIKRGTKCEFRTGDMWEFYYDKYGMEGDMTNPVPLDDDPLNKYFRYYGHNVHKSRVMKLVGITAPSFVRPRLRGWGMSITETMVRSVNQYLKSSNVAFEVLDEFKVDIFQLDGLADSMQNAEGEQQIKSRVALTNRSKNYLNAMVLDAKDKYEQKQLTFSGLADVMREIRIQVASDLRMPLTKLFGISATGFNSGEEDLENYNGMVESEVRMKIRHHIVKTALICCQILFGKSPSDLTVEFNPLRTLTATDQETVKNHQLDRLIKVRELGAIDDKQFKEAINAAKLLPVQLDTNTPMLGSELDQGDDDPANEPGRQGLTREEAAKRE